MDDIAIQLEIKRIENKYTDQLAGIIDLVQKNNNHIQGLDRAKRSLNYTPASVSKQLSNELLNQWNIKQQPHDAIDNFTSYIRVARY